MVTMRDLIPWRSERMPGGRHREVMHPLESLHREIDRMFDDMWRGFDWPLFGRSERWAGMEMPRVDVTEDEKAFRIHAELPGMEEKDVEVVLTDERLTIKGEKRAEKTEEAKEGYTYSERSYGSFERSFAVGSDIKADEIAAEFKNGVLAVTLPKTEEARKHYKRIPIQGAKKH